MKIPDRIARRMGVLGDLPRRRKCRAAVRLQGGLLYYYRGRSVVGVRPADLDLVAAALVAAALGVWP